MTYFLTSLFVILTPEKPQPPASCPVVSLISACRLVLSWSGPCYDGGSAILGYVVEVKSKRSGDWTELTTQCKSTSYSVSSGLQPREEYCFRARAYNAVGVSEPGPVSPVVRMEQKGEMIQIIDTSRENAGKYNAVYITAEVSFFCIDSNKAQEEEAPRAYARVSIVTDRKVTDDYILQEKLGT